MKKFTALLLMLFIFLFFGINTYALETSAQDIFPSEAGQMLLENGFSSIDSESLLNLTPSQVFNYLLELVKNELDTPFVLLYLLFLVIVIVSIVSGVNGGYLSRELDKSITTIGILSICCTALVPVISCMEETRQFVSDLSGFGRVFTPVFSSVMVMSGQIKSGAGYQVIMLFASEFISVFISNIIMPLVFFYFAFTIVGRTVFDFNIDNLSSSVKSMINISLTFSMTVFVSLITLKGIIGASTDSITLRTGRFFIGSFVPAVGSALSEAVGTIHKSVGLIKGTTGVFGIIAAIMYFLPPLIKVLIFKFTCVIASFLGQMLGTGKISELLKDVSNILSLLVSIILSTGSIFVLSTAITLVLSSGG